MPVQCPPRPLDDQVYQLAAPRRHWWQRSTTQCSMEGRKEKDHLMQPDARQKKKKQWDPVYHMSTARSTSCAFLVTALRCAAGTTTATMQRAHLFSAEFLVRRSDCDDLGIMPRVMNRQREKMEKEELIIFKKKSITVQVRHRRRSTFFSQAQAAMFFFFLSSGGAAGTSLSWLEI